MGRILHGKRGTRNVECGTSMDGRAANDHACLFRVPTSAFRVSLPPMPIQAISWSPTGAVRIVDQRALPDALVHRDLETIDDAATAIRTLQLRGAPLIGIAAAMGLVAGLRDARPVGRDAFLAQIRKAAACLAETRPTAVNLRWALARMIAVAEQTPGTAAAVWERLRSEATAIWEEDRAMCRRIGEAGLSLVPDGANVLTHCN